MSKIFAYKGEKKKEREGEDHFGFTQKTSENIMDIGTSIIELNYVQTLVLHLLSTISLFILRT